MTHHVPDDAPGREAKPGERVSAAFAALILTAALVNPLANAPLFSVLPAISEHFAATENAAVLVRGLLTSVSIALVFGAPLAGYFVERLNIRPVLLTAIGVFTLAGGAGFFIDNLWVLLASRLLLGIADAFIGVLTISLIATRLDPVRRNRWIGWFIFASTVGALALIPLSGAISQFGWRYIFLLYGLGGLIFISAAIAVKDEPERAPSAPASAPARSGAAIPIGLIAVGLAAGAVENTAHLFLPFHLADMGVTSPSTIARAVLLIALGGAVSAFLYGQVRTFITIRWTFVLAFAVGGAALIWLGLAQDFAAVLVGAGCLGLGVGLLAPNLNAFAAGLGDASHRARNVGIGRGAFFAGAPLAQLLLEPVSRADGAGSAIVALGCSALLLMLWPLAASIRAMGRESSRSADAG